MSGVFRVLWLCARYELLLAVRSRWLQIFAVVFAGLSLAIAGSGYVLSGGHGIQDFSRTAVSLVQVVLLLVPLAALVFGGLALTPERGAAEPLYRNWCRAAALDWPNARGMAHWKRRSQSVSVSPAWPCSRTGIEGIGRYGALVAMALAVTSIFLPSRR